VLQKLARETTVLKKVEMAQTNLAKQVSQREDRLKRMEGSLVRALMEQQRKLLQIIAQVGQGDGGGSAAAV
jgi:streptomycin 6-kinase|tara:strand:+ start:101 stop:313 length:213 start_codon:yes stop_codon:yes gene_type:complete